MRKGKANPIVKEETLVKDVLYAITGSRAGAASVVDKSGRLSGIFTDGDLRRHLERSADLASRKVKEVMTKNPVTIHPRQLAAEALRILEEKRLMNFRWWMRRLSRWVCWISRISCGRGLYSP